MSNVVEIKLLQYTFRFRKLSWREEFAIKFDPKEDRIRTLMAHALTDISGFTIKSVADAKRVLTQVPSSIMERVFIIYKGTMPPERRFSTLGLYKAPEPKKMAKRIMEVEEERERIMDRAEKELESKFGSKELREARDLEKEMLRKNRRGVSPATPDREDKK